MLGLWVEYLLSPCPTNSSNCRSDGGLEIQADAGFGQRHSGAATRELQSQFQIGPKSFLKRETVEWGCCEDQSKLRFIYLPPFPALCFSSPALTSRICVEAVRLLFAVQDENVRCDSTLAKPRQKFACTAAFVSSQTCWFQPEPLFCSVQQLTCSNDFLTGPRWRGHNARDDAALIVDQIIVVVGELRCSSLS